jgi:hypothetical protein
MSVTTTTLIRAAGVSAAAAGLIFIGVQVNHPPMEVASVVTTEWAVRNTLKVIMAVLALAGITGLYLRQVKESGVLGLIGYLVLGTGFVAIMAVAFVSGFVLPSLAGAAPGYVTDTFALIDGGTVTGDLGLLPAANAVQAVGYLAGGLLFGIALLRARVVSRWAAALLVAGTVAAAAVPFLPHTVDRMLAYPTGVALVWLGISLVRSTRTVTPTEPAAVRRPTVTTAGAR